VGVFSPFWPGLPCPGRQPTGNFLAHIFFETWPNSASLKPFNDFLAHLGPKLWLKNLTSDKNEKIHKRYDLLSQGKFWPTITRQQIELESCSNPVKTREVL